MNIEDIEIKDDKLFADCDFISIREGILYIKNVNFNKFTWNNDGINEPFNARFIIEGNKFAHLLIDKNPFVLVEVKDYEIQRSLQGVTFINCEFTSLPCIMNSGIKKIVYKNCTFHGGDSCLSHNILQYREKLKVSFTGCSFKKFYIGDIGHMKYASDVRLCKFNVYGGKIDWLRVENVEVASKFNINRQSSLNEEQTDINNLSIRNATFKEKFKLHHCDIQNSAIKDSDFDEQVDFFKSIFHNGVNRGNDKTIYFHAINFRKLTLFGECHFKQKVIFKYVTFEDFSHFKKANFLKGLDLDDANIQKEMNFFDIQGLANKEGQKETSRETYRTIKYNLQKIGNQIDANKYHVLELNAKRRDTSIILKNLQDYIVYNGHFITSNFGSSILRPLFWIFIVSVITLCSLDNSNLLDYPKNFQYLSILANIDLSKHPLLFIFHKSSLGYLYYQFINAVRRDVKK